jgi:hypothetical protein
MISLIMYFSISVLCLISICWLPWCAINWLLQTASNKPGAGPLPESSFLVEFQADSSCRLCDIPKGKGREQRWRRHQRQMALTADNGLLQGYPSTRRSRGMTILGRGTEWRRRPLGPRPALVAASPPPACWGHTHDAVPCQDPPAQLVARCQPPSLDPGFER